MRVHAVVVVVGFVVTPRLAGANAAAPFSRPTGAVSGAVVERASPLVVEREDLAIDCTRDTTPIHPECSFVATYFLHNPTEQEEELLGAFYSAERPQAWHFSHPFDAQVGAELDGVDVEATATPEQLERMEAIVTEDPEIASLSRGVHGETLRRTPFRIVVAGGQRARLVFRGRLLPQSFEDKNPREGYIVPPIVARHPFGASWKALAWDRSEEDYLYLVSPISGWAGDPEVHVSIRHFAANDLSTSSPGSPWATSLEHGVVTARTVTRASARQNLRFRVVYAPPVVHHGGPVVGIGPRIGREELRVRFGYEVGLGSSMVLAASAETNFDRYLTAAATLDVASPCFAFIIPSLAVGAGVPVQFRQDEQTRVGVRGQFAISWPIVSFVFPIDVYPEANSSASHVEGSFLTQLSF